MAGKLDKAVEARIQKATITWKHASRMIFRGNAFNRKIKVTLWNSLIRSTMIYGLRTRDIPRHMLRKMEIYLFKQIRTMINPNWKIEAWYLEKPTLQRNNAVKDEIAAQQNENHDNADANARQPNDTPKKLQRDAHAEN